VTRFLASRLRHTALVALIVATLAFVLVRAAPGDPFSIPEGVADPGAARAALRAHYGLDAPLWRQYPTMLLSFARGEFGTSFASGAPVAEVVRQAIGRSFLLMAPALLIGALLGTALGTWQGWRRGRMADRVASVATTTVLAVPEFLIALAVSLLFAVRLRWFPATGMLTAGAASGSIVAQVGDFVRHAVLPVGTLSVLIAAVVARFQRGAVAEALHEEFVRAARARGASRRTLVVHVLRRTAPALCTLLGLLAPSLVGGAALVEFVFGWPGAGYALVNAVTGRDYPVVVAFVTVGAVAVCLSSAIADAMAAALNPRVRLDA
jgi:peptide/nickel transport system permease protein